MENHRVSREPETILQAFQISVVSIFFLIHFRYLFVCILCFNKVLLAYFVFLSADEFRYISLFSMRSRLPLRNDHRLDISEFSCI